MDIALPEGQLSLSVLKQEELILGAITSGVASVEEISVEPG